MSGYLESIEDSERYNNYKLTADKVIQSLSAVKDERSKSRRRWIWELMQNAKDVPNIYGSVTIEIILNENEFVFSHNANPFRVENITGLIQQVSSGKPSNSSNKRITGKFGTGFISTHLLSDVVKVEGIVEKDGLCPKVFDIELNRESEESEELIKFIALELEKIKKIDDENIFPLKKDYHSIRTESDFDTKFIYPLKNQESKDAAKIGIDDLANTLPQTLFFVEELKKVIIKNNVDGYEIVYELSEIKNIDDFSFVTIKEIRNGNINDLNFIQYKNDDLDLAIQVNNFIDKKICVINNSPKLFRDFPLVGTENFYFPFYLNGLSFYPTEKRDGILLTDINSKNVETNRNILKSAIIKAQEFTNWLINNNYNNLSLLAISNIPKNLNDEEVLDWYKNIIQKPYRTFLNKKPIVETKRGKINLEDAIIPKYNGNEIQNEAFWEILNMYFGEDKMCKKEDLFSWHENLGNDSEDFAWDNFTYFTIDKLAKEIESKCKIESLYIASKNINQIEWLNIFYKFLIENKLTDFFHEYKIIPTINGNLKSFKEELFIENSVTILNELILIYKKIKGEDWNDILVHRSIITIDPSHASKTIKDISDEINKVLNFEEKNQYGIIQKSFIDIENCETILLEILHLAASSDSFQTKLFELGKSYFKSNLEIEIKSGISDFNFFPAKKQFIKLLIKSIENSKTLHCLPVTNSETWLLDFLLLLQNNSEFKHYLEEGNIIPNRKKVYINDEIDNLLSFQFKSIKEIYAFGTEDNPLNDDLIDILYDLNEKEDWNTCLINDVFRKIILQPKKIDELGIKIQEEIDRLKIDNSYATKSTAILKLHNWCNKNNNDAQKYMGTFLSQKDNILVNISLDDPNVGGNLVKLLANKDNLPELVAISESGVNLTSLSEIAEISHTIGIEIIKNLAIQLKEDKDDFEFKAKIGKEVEMAFIGAFDSMNLPFQITYQGIGSQDVIITNPVNNKQYFIELKSLSSNNWNKNIYLAISQAKMAVNQINEENYTISILVRPPDFQTTTVDYIKQNLSSQINIGMKLTNVIKKEEEFENLLNDSEAINLSFKDTTRKVLIPENIWKLNTIDFERLIENIKSYLEK